MGGKGVIRARIVRRIAAFVAIVCFQTIVDARRVAAPTPISPPRRAPMDPAFVNAGKGPGLEIWRIENFKPVPYPKNDYGKFYTGDAYIVLNTKQNRAGDKSWDVHFWLGAQSTQDEAGTAAILAVQLDDQLSGNPIQHREVQEHESQLFLSYFKNGIRYQPGGVSTGFAHVDPNAFEKRLFQVKGSRNIRVKQVDPTASAMNKGDCFILDVGRTIYVYVGIKSKRVEKLKAIAAANQIRDQDHAGKARVNIIDEFSSPSDFDEFFAALGGGSAATVPDDSAGGDDQQFENEQERIVALYKVNETGGKVRVDLVAQKPLQQSQLDPSDCFILDSTDSNVFVWVGKQCTEKEKSEAMNKAQAFLTSKNYPSWTHVQRIVQGAEPTAFTQYFQTWKGASELRPRLVRATSSQENDSFDARLFHAHIPEDSNRFRIEEVVDFQQWDLNEDDVMILDAGKEIYVWIGRGASVEERTKSPDLARIYARKYNRDSEAIRAINQGEEPDTFTSLFPTWEDDYFDNITPYDEIKANILANNGI